MLEPKSEREKAGLEVIKKMGWGHNEALLEIDEEIWRLVSEINFGAIWSRPGLSLRDRELICLSILIAIGAPGVSMHFKHAHQLGFSEEELREVILQCIPYAGFPKAIQAMAAFKRVMSGESPSL